LAAIVAFRPGCATLSVLFCCRFYLAVTGRGGRRGPRRCRSSGGSGV